MTPWCCRTGGDQPHLWLVRSQSHSCNYTVTLTRRAISPGKVGRPKRRRREGATACGLSLCTILVPCQIFFPLFSGSTGFSFLPRFPVIVLSFTLSVGETSAKEEALESLPAFSWGSPFFSTSASFFWWDGQSFIATPVKKKKNHQGI